MQRHNGTNKNQLPVDITDYIRRHNAAEIPGRYARGELPRGAQRSQSRVPKAPADVKAKRKLQRAARRRNR